MTPSPSETQLSLAAEPFVRSAFSSGAPIAPVAVSKVQTVSVAMVPTSVRDFFEGPVDGALGVDLLAPADATREAEAVLRYRTDKVKQLDAEVFQ